MDARLVEAYGPETGSGSLIRMTMSEPQSAKNIDPKAREIAKDLARRSGMTLG